MEPREETQRAQTKAELIVLTTMVLGFAVWAVFAHGHTERGALEVCAVMMAGLYKLPYRYASFMDNMEASLFLGWVSIAWNAFGAALAIVGGIKAMSNARDGLMFFPVAMLAIVFVILNQREKRRRRPLFLGVD